MSVHPFVINKLDGLCMTRFPKTLAFDTVKEWSLGDDNFHPIKCWLSQPLGCRIQPSTVVEA